MHTKWDAVKLFLQSGRFFAFISEKEVNWRPGKVRHLAYDILQSSLERLYNQLVVVYKKDESRRGPVRLSTIRYLEIAAASVAWHSLEDQHLAHETVQLRCRDAPVPIFVDGDDVLIEA